MTLARIRFARRLQSVLERPHEVESPPPGRELRVIGGIRRCEGSLSLGDQQGDGAVGALLLARPAHGFGLDDELGDIGVRRHACVACLIKE
jgi:hypothetical protein